MTTTSSPTAAGVARPSTCLLPRPLLELPMRRLHLPADVLAATEGFGLLTVGDLLQAEERWLGADAPLAAHVDTIRTALQQALHDGLRQFEAEAHDWPTLRAQLFGPLNEDQRRWLDEIVGIEQPPSPRPLLAAHQGVRVAEIDERAERLRATFAERATDLMARMRHAIVADLNANDGVTMVEHAHAGTMLHTLSTAGPDRLFGLRLAAFLFSGDLHCHRNALFALSPRRFRRLLRDLPRIVPPHRLPLPIDTVLAELNRPGQEYPRGAVLHLLRSELHIAIEIDGERGEVAAADPRSVRARIAELLTATETMSFADLVYAWREQFRRGSRTMLLAELKAGDEFVQTGPDTWALRFRFAAKLTAVRPLVDKVARRLAKLGGRHHVADLLSKRDKKHACTVWLVLDRLRHDPRVRLLGRGDACAATHRRSRIMETTLQAMRKAAGDVVVSLFLDNQAPEHRRLIARLLRHNRLFVETADDRIDTLSNWPFNEERLRRLIALVEDHLVGRAGYAHASALKQIVDRTDLGGEWLTERLLSDLLRRNGPFEVLPGGVVARAAMMLGSNVQRSVRQALRDAGVAMTVEEVLRVRPELGEFASSLQQLLSSDPLVQTDDGVMFSLA